MKTSRRNLLAQSGALLALAASGVASKSVYAEDCPSGFDYKSYTINGTPIQTAFGEHGLTIHHYSTSSYVVGASSTETRHLLTADVGPFPDGQVYHPVESGAFSQVNTITDIYVFNQADNSLLYWKKLGSGDLFPGAMFVVSSAIAAMKLKITVVARCSLHGYWGMDFDMGQTPESYKSAVNMYDSSQICGGASISRPYIAVDATGGQGDLGILHRPNIIKVANDQVRVFLGGNLDGSGKHPRFASNHYVMGGILFDQDGNLLSRPQNVIYSASTDQQVTFTGLDLAAQGVETLRAVMFDSLQGRFMSFLDVA